MGKKRKQAEVQEVVKKDDTAPPRPKRTLLGWKDGAVVKKSDSAVFRNKEKVLVTCSRRINSRYRHLMMDVVSLLPHCKKDSKVESKETKGATLNEIVELRNCSSILFFECRKQKDLYLWMAKSPGGPSAKFLVNAVHTMEELKLTGNHLKGSRPILTFSSNFDEEPHWKLLKELIMQTFGTPKDHGKAKPFHDHVFVFSIVDRHIWFRNYQISVPHNEIDKVDRGGLDKMTLVEVGPRFCLNPIKIFGGSFGGPTLYENPLYISPNLERAQLKREKATKYVKKVKAKTRRKMHVMENPLEPDEFADLWKE
ncbi:ribosome biogenesis protein BRX1 homolog 2-like [Dioscorea cayenensis subsp. rotundata]|uniref:Ribosome biogenesis protein BRX1 homolog 2-like n=1 Tax=Dioscorea cayennensis subsp. rotundata TaxID=55577 RepID=A0AB40BR65_DIOCR|nr:ribosome biogenesis protein BRX1 homolog 2-like [Dioscorea cayenensis subsp. rotundata]